ncbi:MAG: CPBP family intramembrane metalloprotease [Brevefilum sp.]|nr:CPBP family intramembrane metalloprotease [Brevefilum sp.]
MNLAKVLLQILWVLLMAAVLLGVPRLAGLAADQFDYSAVDPDGAFAWISVHHIVQALIFLALMLAISKLGRVQFGFGWGDRQVGWFYVRLFALIFAGYVVVSLLITILSGSFQGFQYPLNARNVSGQLGFQLLLSGPSEELIFRAFAMTMLGLLISGGLVRGETGFGRVITSVFGGELSIVNLIAAVIFGLAHVSFSFSPFSASFSTGQVIYAIALGLFYGVCYERSGSMIYPMIMHSISNVVAVGMSIIATLIIS